MVRQNGVQRIEGAKGKCLLPRCVPSGSISKENLHLHVRGSQSGIRNVVVSPERRESLGMGYILVYHKQEIDKE